ncbi:MAG: hypothetical protein F4041_02220 [Acidobacteriia bacterium]|nr:hypothetical protein [Terriglobia bacterium]
MPAHHHRHGYQRLALDRHDLAHLDRPHQRLHRFLERTLESQVFAQLGAAWLVAAIRHLDGALLGLLHLMPP